jgi:hypothetical protein
MMLVEITTLQGTPQGERTLSELERLLLDNFAGVFHWGLDWDAATADDVRHGYPGAAKFREVMRKLDPGQLLANRYTQRVGIHTLG